MYCSNCGNELNEKAVIGSAGNPNIVNLTYSNNPNKGGEGETGKTHHIRLASNISTLYQKEGCVIDKHSTYNTHKTY